MTIETIELAVANGKGSELEITLRGQAEKVIEVLIGGLPREALLELHEALGVELTKRRTKKAHSADAVATPKE